VAVDADLARVGRELAGDVAQQRRLARAARPHDRRDLPARDVEIDWQGARQVRAACPGSVSVFILPPSRAELERRLRSRGSDDAAAIARRLADSRVEISHAGDFDYVVVNDQFADALGDLRAIVACQRLRREAQANRHAALLADLLKAD
jgi:guanylate kinase